MAFWLVLALAAGRTVPQLLKDAASLEQPVEVTYKSSLTGEQLRIAELGAIFCRAVYHYDKANPVGSVSEWITKIAEEVYGGEIPDFTFQVQQSFEDAKIAFTVIRFTLSNKRYTGIAFRGTINLANVITDLASMASTKGYGLGFKLAFDSMRVTTDTILSVVSGHQGDDDAVRAVSDGLFFFGHSLGGSLANYVAHMFAKGELPHADKTHIHIIPPFIRSKVAAITFGQPRSFQQCDEHFTYPLIRFIVQGDVIPTTPIATNCGDAFVLNEAGALTKTKISTAVEPETGTIFPSIHLDSGKRHSVATYISLIHELVISSGTGLE